MAHCEVGRPSKEAEFETRGTGEHAETNNCDRSGRERGNRAHCQFRARQVDADIQRGLQIASINPQYFSQPWTFATYCSRIL